MMVTEIKSPSKNPVNPTRNPQNLWVWSGQQWQAALGLYDDMEVLRRAVVTKIPC